MSSPRLPDVVVIGGGITGVSTLYHLARSGVEAQLFEREMLAAGSTSKAAGGIRAQFSDELNVRIMVESIRRFERFADEPGGEIDYRQWGYLFLLSAEHVPRFTRSVAVQQSLGVDVHLIRPEEAAAIVPDMNLDGVAAATFSPTDGHATPESVVQAYAGAARRLGAHIDLNRPVREIVRRGDRVAGVVTDAGTIECDHVIVAAGVWTNELLAPLGIELPIEPEKRSVFLSQPGDPLPRAIPLTIDVGTGFYFHREGEALLIAGRHFTIEELAPHALARLPFLADSGIRPGWTGFYDSTPDRNPIIESAAEIAGLSYAAGFSGHGFMQGPVVGDYLACLVTGAEPPVDLSPFSSARFARGDLRLEENVI